MKHGAGIQAFEGSDPKEVKNQWVDNCFYCILWVRMAFWNSKLDHHPLLRQL